MARSQMTKQDLKLLLAEYTKLGRPTITVFADAINKPRRTVTDWFKRAAKLGLDVSPADKLAVTADGTPSLEVLLKDKVKSLESIIAAAQREVLDEHYVKSKIMKMADEAAEVEPPKWLTHNKASKSSPGVPTLFASDWHWGERVFENQTGGLNKYDMAIAQRRARALVTNAIDLLENHMVNPKYPGIVFVLGGDMVSGGIHEELMATDEMEIMPVVLDLFGVLCWCISTLADKFGQVFVPCVSGNHGRSTHKIRCKGRNFTSYDWLLYQFLARFFKKDKRVQFSIPDGSDCAYSVYGHRYLLTHGDQARGGDGIIGMLGPVIRMDHRKRSRASQIDESYDTLLLGHFHQLTQLRRLIINGSLKGYDEYANACCFSFERPQQGLWITHPTRGITFSMPVHVDEPVELNNKDWVSWKK